MFSMITRIGRNFYCNRNLYTSSRIFQNDLDSFKTQAQETLDNITSKLTLEPKHQSIVSEITVDNLKVFMTPDGNLKPIWKDLLLNDPRIFLKHKTNLLKIHEILLSSKDYNVENAIGFFKRCPEILFEDFSIAQTNLLNWLSFCSRIKLSCLPLISEEPSIICYSYEEWSQIDEMLKKYFSKEAIVDIISSSPIILTEDSSIIENKIVFLLHEMNIHWQDIADLGVLNFDHETLKDRYYFLCRCGIYKHPNPKSLSADVRPEPSTEKLITDNLKLFLNTTTNNTISIEEYNRFLTINYLEKNENYLTYKKEYIHDIETNENEEEEEND